MDRIDNCWRLSVTSHGRLVCARGSEVWVYESDGGAESHFPSGHAIGLVGDEAWVVHDGSLEHRSDTTAGMRLDGIVANALLVPAVGARFGFGVSEPGSIVVIGGTDAVVQGFWDGGLPTTRDFRDLYELEGQVFLVDGDTVWGEDMCFFAVGCQGTPCQALKTCPFGRSLGIVGFDDDAVWVVDDAAPGPALLSLRSRPLATSSILAGPRPIPASWSGVGLYENDGRPFITSTDGNRPHTLIPIRDANGFHFRFSSRRPVSVSEKWLIFADGERTLTFVPR
ncbi:MAG: hypothetical protein ABL982_14555 [Vicinamibacterales bacterium]